MIFSKETVTRLGKMTLTACDDALIAVRLGESGPGEQRDTPLLVQAERQMLEYLAGERRAFTLPLSLQGTPFQQQVWQALRDIPYGETRTYGQIAQTLGNAKACRAVGMANNKNPLLIIVPCHRVIGANGALTGYAAGLHVKEELLKLESNVCFREAKLTSRRPW